MHTPPSASPSSPGGDGASIEDARAAIGTVISWYSRELLDARRSGDQQRLEEIRAEMLACAEDRRRLGDASPGEIERLTGLYAERLGNLEAGEG